VSSCSVVSGVVGFCFFNVSPLSCVWFFVRRYILALYDAEIADEEKELVETGELAGLRFESVFEEEKKRVCDLAFEEHTLAALLWEEGGCRSTDSSFEGKM